MGPAGARGSREDRPGTVGSRPPLGLVALPLLSSSAGTRTTELGRIAHSYVYDPYGLTVYSAGAEYAPEEDVVVDDAQVPDGQTSAEKTITTSGNVTVASGTNVLFRAGAEVSLGSGFTVELGATFTVEMSSVESWVPAEPNTRYQYTDQELDAETDWYYYGARYYDPVLGRFLQADPVLDGLNRYSYVHGNPVRYTDPTGYLTDEHRQTLADLEEAGAPEYVLDSARSSLEKQERERIDEMAKNLEGARRDAEGSNDQELSRVIVETLWNQLFGMISDYNRDIVPRYVEDWGGERLSGRFEDTGDYVTKYKQNPHPGIDFVGGSGFRTPWYTVIEYGDLTQSSHPLVLSVPGTPYRVRVKHGDSEDVLAVDEQAGGIMRPGAAILPYPERGNGTSDDTIHFHVEVRTTNPRASAPMVNPLGLSPGSRRRYLFDYGPDSGGWMDMSYRW